MPRLSDLLEWLARPELASVWLLLDIKTDDDPDLLMPAIARTVASVPPAESGKGWKERIVVGGWNVRFPLPDPFITLTRPPPPSPSPYPPVNSSPNLPKQKQENYIHHARLHLPGHALAYIGFSLLYARRFLSDKHADVHFNLFQPSLVGPLGARFRRAIRERGRKLFVWTVNEEGWMEWAVRKGVDGVITDEVDRLGGVLDRFGVGAGSGVVGEVGVVVSGDKGVIKWPGLVGLYARAVVLQAAALVFSLLLWRRLSTVGSKRKPSGVTVPGKR